MVALTLLINAPTSAMVYTWLKIYPENNYRVKLDAQSVNSLMDYTYEQVRSMTIGSSGRSFAVEGFHRMARCWASRPTPSSTPPTVSRASAGPGRTIRFLTNFTVH